MSNNKKTETGNNTGENLTGAFEGLTARELAEKYRKDPLSTEGMTRLPRRKLDPLHDLPDLPELKK